MKNNITEVTNLYPISVGEIKGEFIVSRYQRGYRWGEDEVVKLLEDIYECLDDKGKYYLQPIVVKKMADGRFELIDGQQRLTTLLLLYQVFGKTPHYSINYETRPETAKFLSNIDTNSKEENPDYYYIVEAYEALHNWFERFGDNKERILTKFYLFVEEKLSVIWYHVPELAISSAIFTRLNIGKIPLTNAELVKALIFRGEVDSIKMEWSFKWDLMERKLHNKLFWGFLTNKSAGEYDTRIELIFDLISEKDKKNNPVSNFTFDYFYKLISKDDCSQTEIWSEIWEKFNLLSEWYEDRDLYHKIGYLIAIGEKLTDIISMAKNLKKNELMNKVNNLIQKSIIERSISDFSYEKNKNAIQNILLLFNVESVRAIQHETQLFPFYLHKGKHWSLEHIHAQNDEGLKTQKQWQEWIDYYSKALESLGSEDAIKLREEILEKKSSVKKEDYLRFNEKIIPLFTYSDLDDGANNKEDNIHSINNMALLGQDANSVFNNAVFAVKRQRMIELEKKGEYIPFCTKRVFLKYYTVTGDVVQHFWTPNDRDCYLSEMKNVLSTYFILTD